VVLQEVHQRYCLQLLISSFSRCLVHVLLPPSIEDGLLTTVTQPDQLLLSFLQLRFQVCLISHSLQVDWLLPL
jgi:hypothetical protein